MRYLIRISMDGRIRYVYADNINDARYIFDLVKKDMINGEVNIWAGDNDLAYAAKVGGELVSERATC